MDALAGSKIGARVVRFVFRAKVMRVGADIVDLLSWVCSSLVRWRSSVRVGLRDVDLVVWTACLRFILLLML